MFELRFLRIVFIVAFYTLSLVCNGQELPKILVPIKVEDRFSWNEVQLTDIGDFGYPRKPRKHIPGHLHTGIDIKRPKDNYRNEPIYSCFEGQVISVRRDRAYSKVIIEHTLPSGKKFWSAYEHIGEIKVRVGEWVTPETSIARFFSKEELNRDGWHFDHLHFELLKKEPERMDATKDLPERFWKSHTLTCHDRETLLKCFFDPAEFLE